MRITRIFGFDLGTTCGVAKLYLGDGIPNSGSIRLATDKELKSSADRRAIDPRAIRFERDLREILPIDRADETLVVFEDVRFAKSLAQVQLWASFRGILWAHFDGCAFMAAVQTGHLKKFATGHGDADKSDMRTAALRKWGATWISDWDDNAVDAAWLAEYGRVNLLPTLQ